MHILSFKPEVLLYIYLAGCGSVLLFNIVYIFLDRYRGKREDKRSLRIEKQITEQVERLKGGQEVEAAHYRSVLKDFRNLNRLETFERSVTQVIQYEPLEYVQAYLQSLRGIFIQSIPVFSRKDGIAKGYFAYLVEQFRIDSGQKEMDGLMEFLTEIAIEEGEIVRENALRALYTMGNADAILNVWQKMNENRIFHSSKLLADGLAMFTGDKKKLARLLWSHRTEFSEELVLPVMQFIRFFVGGFEEEYCQILKSQDEGKELLLEIIRYFKKYRYEPVKEILIRYLEYMEFVDWEYAAIAAMSLASYPGEDTVRWLKKGLTSHNWYVRLNSAEALVLGLKLSDMELADVYNGPDRYAREILLYAKNHAKIESQILESVG